MLATLAAPTREIAWADIEEQLNAFATSDGWSGPNELLLATGVR